MAEEKKVELEKGLVEFFVRFIDTMSQRGNIRGDELSTVGQVRNVLVERYQKVYAETPGSVDEGEAEEG